MAQVQAWGILRTSGESVMSLQAWGILRTSGESVMSLQVWGILRTSVRDKVWEFREWGEMEKSSGRI